MNLTVIPAAVDLPYATDYHKRSHPLFITLSNLASNTNYSVSVYAICGSNDVSFALTTTFRTACGAVTVPQTYTFEDDDANAMPACWLRHPENTGVYVVANNANSGSKSLRFYSGTNRYVALPQITVPATGFQVTFWTRPESATNSSCATLQVGYITNPDDFSSFNMVEEYAYNDWSSASYEQKTVTIPAIPEGSRVAFYHTATSGWYWFLDDITVEAVPTCLPVTDLTVSGYDAESVTLTWNDTINTATTYTVFVNDSMVALGVSQSEYTVTGLNPSTNYTFGVVANCSADDASEMVTVNATTDCAGGNCTITIVGNDSYGDGWNGNAIDVIQNGDVVANFTLTGGSALTSEISFCAGIPISFSWTTGDYADEASFEIKNTNGMVVYSATGDEMTNGVFMTLNSCDATPEIAYDTTSATACDSYEWNGETYTESGYYLYQDATLHAIVLNLTILNSTSTQLQVTAEDSYTWYDVTYNVSGQFTHTEVAANGCDSVVILNLTVTYNNIAAPATLPYATGFEDGDDTGWEYANNANNAWVIGSAASNGGANGLYISNDNGASNAYGNSAAAESYAYRAFTVDEAGEYTVTFDWLAEGESNYDFLRAWIAPASFQFVADQLPDGSTSSYQYGTSTPEGWFDLGGKMNSSTSWQTEQNFVTFAQTGNYYIVFMWCNDGSAGSNPAAAIDNVTIAAHNCGEMTTVTIDTVVCNGYLLDQSTSYIESGIYADTILDANGCPAERVINLTVNHASAAEMFDTALGSYTWIDGVVYDQSGTYTVTYPNGNVYGCDSSVILHLIVQEIPYEVACDNGNSVTVSNATEATGTIAYLPGYSMYNYSYSEVIIPASQLQGIGTVKALQFKPASTDGGNQFSNCELYLANTAVENLSSGFIQDANSFQMVWSGDMNYTNTKWQTIEFTSNFEWDGVSNIVVALRRNNGTYSGTSSFESYTDSLQRGRYVYQDAGPYTIGSVGDGNATYNSPLYRLIGCEGVEPATDTTINDTIIAGDTIIDASISATDIIYWVGEGENEAILAVNWVDTALAWGYRWNGNSATVATMLTDIANADPRLGYESSNAFLTDIIFQDSSLYLSGSEGDWGVFWMVLINGSMDNMGMRESIADGDLVKWVDYYADNDGTHWTMPIYPVSIPDIIPDIIPDTTSTEPGVDTISGTLTITMNGPGYLYSLSDSFRIYNDTVLTNDAYTERTFQFITFNPIAAVAQDGGRWAPDEYCRVTSITVDGVSVNLNMNMDGENNQESGFYFERNDQYFWNNGVIFYNVTIYCNENESHTLDVQYAPFYSDSNSCISMSSFNTYDVTDTTAMVSWVAGTGTHTYNLQYGPVEAFYSTSGQFFEWENYMDTNITTYDTLISYMMTGLEPNRQYVVRVQMNCDNGGWWFSYRYFNTNFRIAGDTTGSIADLPYTTGFEAGDDVAWTIWNGANGWFVGNATSNGGSNALYISKDNGTSNSYTITSPTLSYAFKAFNLEAGQYALSFDWIAQGEEDWDFLRVAYAPHGTEAPTSYSSWTYYSVPSGFTSLDGGQLSMSNSWQTINTEFSIDESGVYDLYFVWRNNDGYDGSYPPAAIDNVCFKPLTCPAPTNLAVSDITDNSATLSWNAGGNETSWKVIINDDEYIVSQPTLTISNLSPVTNYSVDVYALCDTNDVSFALSNAFRTVCGIVTMPYAENFNNWSYGPECWTYLSGIYSTTPETYEDNSAWIFTGSFSNNIITSGNVIVTSLYVDHYWAVTPTIAVNTDDAQINVDVAVFKYRPNTQSFSDGSTFTDDDNFIIAATTDGGISYTTLLQYSADELNALNSNYTTLTVPLSGFNGQNVRIAFYVGGETYDTVINYLLIDNVSLRAVPTCPDLAGLTVSDITTSTAMLTWTDNGSRSYVILDANDSVVATVSDTTYTITHLLPSTNYTFGVASYCDSSQGLMVTVGFHTPCAAISELPWCEGFENAPLEGSSLPYCWSRYSEMGSSFQHPSVSNYPLAAHDGYRSLHFFDPTGSLNGVATMAILPELDVATYPMNRNRISFWTRLTTPFSAAVSGYVYLCTMSDPNDINTMTVVDSVQVSGESYLFHTVDLTNAVPTDAYLAIRSRAFSIIDLYIDDVTLEVIPGLVDTVYVTACDSYTWDDGETYTESGSYIYEDSASATVLILTINHSVTDTIAETVCNSYTWAGNLYTQSGRYTYTTTNSVGCDSVAILDLTVNQSTTNSSTVEACDSYLWHNVEYTNSGTYLYRYTNTDGCASLDTIYLTIIHPTSSTTTLTACDYYEWNDVTYNQSGLYTYTTTNSVGCDSVATLNLTVNYSNSSTNNATACDSYDWNNNTYTQSGVYNYTTTNAAGCDSVATLNLTINYSTTSTNNATACDTYDWNNNVYTATGVYTFQTTNAAGCDSVATLNLTVNYSNSSTNNATACDSYEWNNNVYTATGVYTYQTTNASGCDSVATLNLTVNYSNSSTNNATACDSYDWNGETYTTTGTYTYQTTNVAGCDSVATLNLTVNYSNSSTNNATACDTYEWNNNVYTATGVYTYQTTNASGCDSVATLNLTVNYSNSSTNNATACDSYDWNGEAYTATGVYTYNTTNAAGCDSVATLNLTVNYSNSSTNTATACDSYVWNNSTYTQSGVYTYQTTNAAGCDSVATLNLTVNYTTTSDTSVTACNYYNWNGTVYTGSTTTTVSLVNAAGCDSLATLILFLNYGSHSAENVTACDSYEWHGNVYTESTRSATFTGTNAVGCDSIVHLYLTIRISSTSYNTATSCNSYTWNGQTYTTAGLYTYTATNSVGCDSVATLDLAINYSTTGTEYATACNSYLWHDVTYLSSTDRATYTTTNAVGCDSVITLNLSINYSTSSVENVTACDSYSWNGQSYTQSGAYSFSTLNAVGCDSTAILNLSVYYSNSGSVSVSACESYIWNGQAYSQSGVYSLSLTNAAGCDSLTTMSLSINHGTSGQETQTACESYSWNGQTYSQSGLYSYTTTNSVGCDSVVSLALTVNVATSSTISASACDSYSWNGQSYTATGRYSYTTSNSVGCDSVATINLTIYASTTSVESQTVCDSYSWNGNTYTSSGVYSYSTTNSVGCDSVATINLTVNYSTTGSETVTACNNYVWNGVEYSQSGTYSSLSPFLNSVGCDSTVTLYLTINSCSTTEITACDSYAWHGNLYTSSGTYDSGNDTLILTINYSVTTQRNVTACDSYFWRGQNYSSSQTLLYQSLTPDGCDSIETVILSINNSSFSTQYATACNSYSWHGQTYSSTGTYLYESSTTAGCDSTVALHLTINRSSSGYEVVSACGSYSWNGITYTSSGFFNSQFSILNSLGCDSVVTLHLTINHCSTVNVDACDSYLWNGVTYNTSGTYTNGTDTLVLNIKHSTSSNEVVTACDSYSWDGAPGAPTSSWAYDSLLTTSGVYVLNLTNAAGCDSVATLNLTINYSAETTVEETATASYEWNGNTYTESGTYTWTGSTEAGCDSIVTLILTINPIGIDGVTAVVNVSIYPNPTRGMVNIVADDEVLKVEVYDLNGRKVATHDNTNRIDLHGLSTGSYTLRIYTQRATAIKRVILK